MFKMIMIRGKCLVVVFYVTFAGCFSLWQQVTYVKGCYSCCLLFLINDFTVGPTSTLCSIEWQIGIKKEGNIPCLFRQPFTLNRQYE